MQFLKSAGITEVSAREKLSVNESGVEKSGSLFEVGTEGVDRPYEAEGKNQDRLCETETFWEMRKLTPEQKNEVRSGSGWSFAIIDAIGSMEEYEIYQEAGLAEAKIGEKACLIKKEIDMEQIDGFGRTNKERMEQGLAPLTPEGRPYELHHIGQHQNSPLAELQMQEHRGRGNDAILHIKTKESEIDREEFGAERAEHWKNRVQEVVEQ